MASVHEALGPRRGSTPQSVVQGRFGDLAVARIGPNAITRVAEALLAQSGEVTRMRVFAAAGLVAHLRTPPQSMVDERDVAALHRALRSTLGAPLTRAVARDAGERTADYLLAHRIPRVVQAVLKVLPARLACPVLLAAIGRHAWTFAGSGVFTARAGRPTRFAIAGCPMCRGTHEADGSPSCDYYAATFERLFRVLVSPAARVRETACEAAGAAACAFEIRW